MSRKDFVAVAAAINNLISAHETTKGDAASQWAVAGITATAEALANVFADANPRFDRARFLAACGIK